MFSRRGSQIVEAAIVLPILILIVASLISLSVFYITLFQAQTALQRSVIREVEEDKHIVRKIEKNDSYSSRIKGLYGGIISKDYTAYRYSLDEGAMIRAGELLFD